MGHNVGVERNLNKGSMLDQFILSRANNMPELIFNQNSNQDQNVKKRFFELDHA